MLAPLPPLRMPRGPAVSRPDLPVLVRSTAKKASLAPARPLSPVALAATDRFSSWLLGAPRKTISELLAALEQPSGMLAVLRFGLANRGFGTFARLAAPDLSRTSNRQERQDVLVRAYHDSLINGPRPARALVSGVDSVEVLDAYARRLGYGGVRAEGDTLRLVLDDRGSSIDLGGSGRVSRHRDTADLLFEAGQRINLQRFGIRRVVPLSPVVEPRSSGFSEQNAYLSAHLSQLAYRSRPEVEAQLRAWGFDLSTFTWIEDAGTDTQGFVVADAAGNRFVSFRGSQETRDFVQTDVSFCLKDAVGSQPGVRVHAGFRSAVESVWPQAQAALLRAQRAPGRGTTGETFFVGHSLGGALAQVAALRAAEAGAIDPKRVQLHTVGSPRVGNEAFMKRFNALFPRAWRAVNWNDAHVDSRDAVAGLPPRSFGYRQAGTLVRLEQGRFRLIGPDDRRARLASPVPGPLAASDDPADPAPERLRGEALRRYTERALHPPPAPVALSASSLNATGAGSQRSIPRASLHSMSVYLHRFGSVLLERAA